MVFPGDGRSEGIGSSAGFVAGNGLCLPIQSTCLISFIKGVKRDSFPTAGFFLPVQPTSFEQDCSCLPFHDLGTLLHAGGALVFLPAVSSLSRNEASRFGDHKRHGCQVPTMVLGDSWPIAFSGCPRGTRVA